MDYFALQESIGQLSHRKHLRDTLETKETYN